MQGYRGAFGWVQPQALNTNWVGRVKSKVLKILGEWSPLYDLLNHIHLFILCFIVINDWSVNAPYSYLGCGMKYQDGKLTVPDPGQYYIYAQLYFHNNGRVFIRVNYKVVTMLQPPVNDKDFHGTVYAGGVFNLNANDVITLTAHCYPDEKGPIIYMAPRHSYFGALLI